MSYPSISMTLPDPFTRTPNNALAPLTGVTHIAKTGTLSLPSPNVVNLTVPTPYNIKASACACPIVIPPTFLSGASPMVDGTGLLTGQWGLQSYYFVLPAGLELISIWGGTSSNEAITIGGTVFYPPQRINNSNNQVQVGDTFTIPIYNLNGYAQAILPGTGGTVATTNGISASVANPFITNKVDLTQTVSVIGGTPPVVAPAPTTDTYRDCIIIPPYNFNVGPYLPAPAGGTNSIFTLSMAPYYLTIQITSLPTALNGNATYIVY